MITAATAKPPMERITRIGRTRPPSSSGAMAAVVGGTDEPSGGTPSAQALRDANERALLEYEGLLERIKALAQALGTARELYEIYRALREFTNVSVPCNGFFVSLYDTVRDVRGFAVKFYTDEGNWDLV